MCRLLSAARATCLPSSLVLSPAPSRLEGRIEGRMKSVPTKQRWIVVSISGKRGKEDHESP